MNFNAEMRPRRELLNPDFEGYKLSLDRLRTDKISLESAVATFSTKERELGFLHFALFAQQTSLFVNRWNEQVYWFQKAANGEYSIARLNPETNAVIMLRAVAIKSETVIPTLHFLPDELLFFSAGDGDFELFGKDGQKESSGRLPRLPDNTDTVLVNDVALANANTLEIAYTFLQIGEEKIATVVFVQFDIEKGTFGEAEEFHSGAVPSYVSIGPSSSLLLASDKLIRHKSDDAPTAPPVAKKFKWRQNLSDLVIFVNFESKVAKDEVKVTIGKANLEVKVRDVEFGGKLFLPIDPEESTWTIAPGGVEILLQKEVERGWARVFEGEDCGEEVFNEDFVSQVHSKLGHLTTEHPMPEEAAKPSVDSNQYEECDRQAEFERVLFRFQAGEWTHKASLSANQTLFWTQVTGREKALGTRNDVDCCLWSPSGSDPKHPMSHIATFDALGYIHAGKRDVAYVQSAPNYAYSVIVEHRRRAMIYRKACALNTALRNRTTGKRVETIGRQQMLNLDTKGAFLGVQCTNDFIFLLEKDGIWKVTLNPESSE